MVLLSSSEVPSSAILVVDLLKSNRRRSSLFCLILLSLTSSTQSFTTISTTISISTTMAENNRKSTLRSISSTLSSFSEHHDNAALTNTKEYVKDMVERAKDGSPMTDNEIVDICNSIENLCPKDSPINFDEVKQIIERSAHLSHKDWSITESNAKELSRSLSIGSEEEDGGSYPLSPHAKQLMERILIDGNWQGAVDNNNANASASTAEKSNNNKPWAVLVTGVNGIRKTTSMYQPWFGQLLSEALVVPPDSSAEFPLIENLPTGSNSFFRQLDHMIATICNEEFCKLYSWAASQLSSDDSEEEVPSDEVVQAYSDYKAAIFSRYRTLSELIGALLLKQAQLININCLMETSGKDVAMFHYVDHFFPTGYNKLALHFTINDLECAKVSVDKRMIHEIQLGAKAVKQEEEEEDSAGEAKTAWDVVYTNQGGPYGSAVLEGVQKDSDQVWNEKVICKNPEVGQDWYKATIAITAHPTEPWTAQAVKPDGTLGTVFTFENKKVK